MSQRKPLANLDYLINPPQAQSYATSKSSDAADRAVEETALALAGPLMAALNKDPQGTQSAYNLVDAMNIRLEDLFSVCDILANKFGWLTVDRSDPKGDYKISLTDRGREYARKAASLRAM
ncbi:MAG: hypothetical protein ACRD3B_17040 [Candidatus Sulfotelmatobacter sp.]